MSYQQQPQLQPELTNQIYTDPQRAEASYQMTGIIIYPLNGKKTVFMGKKFTPFLSFSDLMRVFKVNISWPSVW